MRCQKCQGSNLSGSLFCIECGASLAVVCGGCQEDNPPEARFCRKCGVALLGAAPAAVAPERPLTVSEDTGAYTGSHEGERRQLTVMFCDLVDSAVLGERLDPEDLQEVVQAFQEVCARVVNGYAGHIAMYAGDGLLVYFGYPRAHENDAQRATQAGLDIVRELACLNARLEPSHGVRLAVRVGIHSGLVVVGKTGGGEQHETQVLGHTLNLAARLQGIAEPDSVVISAATAHLVRGLFITHDLGPKPLKGIAQPVTAYRVVRPTAARSRLEVEAATGLTPFIGREQEIALVLDRWEHVIDGRGHVVLLSGEAGIGKSRLVRVLHERLAGYPHLWLEAHCSPYHEHSAFYPVSELLEVGLHVQRDDPAADTIGALERTLASAGLPVGEVLPVFASLLSVPLPEGYQVAPSSPEVQRRNTMGSLISWLLTLSAQRPTVIVVEDLHWIDPSTQEFLGILVEQVPAAPILLLVTFRPTPKGAWAAGANRTHLTLHPLTRNQVGAMINRIAGGKALPVDVHAQVVTKTDGVPLFVEELTKAVIESELLRETANGYERADPLPEFAIPSTLQDSLMARLDRLGPVKDLAQFAAVLGRQFPHDLLVAVAPMDAAFVEHALRELVGAELVYQRGVPPHATYTFKHALVQEAAYQSLLKTRRQESHARIARVLKERFPERVAAEPEELARHCAEGGLTAEAIAYFQLAGEHAAQRSAHVEAVGHLTRGIELLAKLPAGGQRTRLELALRVALGFPLVALRGYGDAEVEQTYARARALCQEIDEAAPLFESVWGLANYYQSRSQLGTAQDLSEQLLTIAEHAHEARFSVWAHLQLGAVLFWRGEPAPASAHLKAAIRLHNPAEPWFLTGAPDPGVAARAYAGLALWQLGCADQALRMADEGVAFGRACAHPFSLALALCFAGILYQLRREPEAVRERAEEAIALATHQEFPLWQGLGHMLLGWAMSRSGAGDRGVAEIHQGLVQLATVGTEVGASGGLVLLGDAEWAAGRTPEALSAVETGLAFAAQRQQHTWEAELYRLKGDILLEMGDDGAEPALLQALETSRRQQSIQLELRAATSLSRLWRQRGRAAEARALLDGVHRRLNEGLDTLDVKDARLLLQDLSGPVPADDVP